MQQGATMHEVANVMARLRDIISRGDPLSIEFANWLGVHDASPITSGSEAELWTAREVAIAALQSASNRPEARSFSDGLVQLRRCKFFATPWNPGVLVTDPFAMLCVAIGIQRIGDRDSAAWLVDLARLTIQSEVQPWRIGLLGAATLILISEPIGKVPPELMTALSAKGLIPWDEGVAYEALAASMAPGVPPPEEAATRLAALRALSRKEGATKRNRKIAQSETKLESASIPTTTSTGNSKIKILFLGTNPSDTTGMALGREVREIEDRRRASRNGDRFEFVQEWAVRIRDLHAVLLRHKPQIVHFSGHGRDRRTNSSPSLGPTREMLPIDEPNDEHLIGELLAEDETGKAVPIPVLPLADLFRIIGGVRCVLLNACHSIAQAEAISKHVDVVVGMNRAIKDDAAINFAWAFYQALAFGEPVGTAFELGRNQIALARLGEEGVPELLLRKSESELVLFSAECAD